MGRRGRREKSPTLGASGRGGRDWFSAPSTPKHGEPKFRAPSEAQELARKKHDLQAQWKAVQDQIATNRSMRLPVSDFLEKREKTLREQLNQIERQESHARASAPAQKKALERIGSRGGRPQSEAPTGSHAELLQEKNRLLGKIRDYEDAIRHSYSESPSFYIKLKEYRQRLAEIERELGAEPGAKGESPAERRRLLLSERARISEEASQAYESMLEYPDSLRARQKYHDLKNRLEQIDAYLGNR